MIILTLSTFPTIAIIVIVIAWALLDHKEQTHEYKAAFGEPSEHLSFLNKGFAIGSQSFTQKLSHTHMLVCGQTGSGKSTLVSINSIASISKGYGSMIVHDISGELWDKTSALLVKKGYTVLRLDFSNSNQSETFNPLLACGKSISEIQKIALMIVQNTIGTGKSSDPFWEQSSTMLISLMIRYQIFYTPPELCTLQNTKLLVDMFAVNGAAVDKLFAATGDQDLLLEYKNFLVIGQKTLSSVIATTRASLHLFSDIEICKTTAANSIDFSLLRTKPVAIFCCSPITAIEYLKPITAIFFQTLFNVVMSKIPSKKDRKIYFIIDEFAAYTFPNMTLTISNMRKFAAMCIIMQDDAALIARYGEANAKQIKTNCGIACYLQGTPLHAAKDLSQTFGRYSFEDDKGIQRQRELMTADEIRMNEGVLVVISNKAPLNLKNPTPYYKSIWLRHLAKAEPYMLNKKELQLPPKIVFAK